MNMKPSMVVAVLAIVLGVLAGYFYLNRIEVERPHVMGEKLLATPVNQAESAVTATAIEGPEADRNTSVPVGLEVNFDEIKNISELIDLLAHSDIGEGQKNQYLTFAAGYCEGAEIELYLEAKRESENKPKKILTDQEVISRNYTKKYAELFCDHPTESSGELIGRSYQISNDDDVIQANGLMSLKSEGKADLARQRAESLLMDATSPDAIARAAFYLLYQDGSGKPKGLASADEVPVPSSVRSDKAKAQLIAVQKLQCSLRGGCGSDGFYSMVECRQRSNCQPGITAEEVWRRSYSPDFLAYSDAVYRLLVEKRKN